MVRGNQPGVGQSPVMIGIDLKKRKRTTTNARHDKDTIKKRSRHDMVVCPGGRMVGVGRWWGRQRGRIYRGSGSSGGGDVQIEGLVGGPGGKVGVRSQWVHACDRSTNPFDPSQHQRQGHRVPNTVIPTARAASVRYWHNPRPIRTAETGNPVSLHSIRTSVNPHSIRTSVNPQSIHTHTALHSKHTPICTKTAPTPTSRHAEIPHTPPQTNIPTETTPTGAWRAYWELGRYDKPTGTFLLFWPCVWGVSMACLTTHTSPFLHLHPPALHTNALLTGPLLTNHPSLATLLNLLPMSTLPLLPAFFVGAMWMRAFGCTLNDFHDRHIDPHVARTRHRPLAAKRLTPAQALGFAAVHALASGTLLLTHFHHVGVPTLAFTVLSLLPVAIYPLMKRITSWPQLFLGTDVMDRMEMT